MLRFFTLLVFVLFSFVTSANLHRVIYLNAPCLLNSDQNDLVLRAERESDTSRLQLDETTNVIIYPNPVKTFANLTLQGSIDRIVIMNIVGKEVKSFSPESGSTELKLNLYDLQPGVYFLAAYYQGAKLITKRFMIEQ